MPARCQGILLPCRGCGRKVVYGPHVLCRRCDDAATERRYQRAKYYYRHTLTLTAETAWAGIGTTLSAAQDNAPLYSEITGYDAKGVPKCPSGGT